MAVLPQAPEDILHIDDRVIDQLADGDRQAAERHGVDRQTEHREHHRSDDNRQRDGRQRDESRPEVHQEQEQDDHDEERAVAERLDHVLNGQIDELFLLIQLGEDPDVIGKRKPHLFQRRGDPLGDFAGVGLRLLEDREHHRRAANHLPRFVPSERRAVATLHLSSLDDARYLGERDRLTVALLHDNVAKLLGR